MANFFVRDKYIRSLDELQDALERELAKNSDAECVNLVFDLENYSKNSIQQILTCVQKYEDAGYIPSIQIKLNNLNFSKEEFECFIDIQGYANKHGLDFDFNDIHKEYSLDDALSAFLKCKNFTDFVNSSNASPFEKYLMIYRYVTSYVYKENKTEKMNSRNIVSVLNSDDIVCVGYANLMKLLCSQVGIKCETQGLEVHNKIQKISGMHRNNFIYIKDEKYGLDGYYYVDACWDSIRKNREPFLQYNFALLPLNDIKKFKFLKLKMEDFALYDDSIFEEMLLSNSLAKRNMEKLGIDFHSEQLSEFCTQFENESSQKLIEAAELVKQMLMKAGIPKDMLKEYAMPESFQPEFLIALAVSGDSGLELVKLNIKRMKEFYHGHPVNRYNSDEGYIKYLNYDYSYNDDMYECYDKFAENGSIINVNKIKKYYERIQLVSKFKAYVDHARSSSVPISEDLFKQAITNSLLCEGYDERHAKIQANRSIEKSRRRAELTLDNDAINCFSTSALLNREKEGG